MSRFYLSRPEEKSSPIHTLHTVYIYYLINLFIYLHTFQPFANLYSFPFCNIDICHDLLWLSIVLRNMRLFY